MARLLLWALLGVIVYTLAKNWLRSGAGRPGDRPPEAIVRCAACGLNVPQSEAHARDGLWYCSREHLERAQGGR
ncbi:MAG TPA: PP0621 family protein [Burkholderiaceae bacterium]|jgi:uncharacterized protein|nr:PP0621 family protein [Burkholderiaceae bacterium]